MNNVEIDRLQDREEFFLSKCQHCTSAGDYHTIQSSSSSSECHSLVEATGYLIACEVTLDGDLGATAIQERLLGIRDARARCHLIAASLKANLRSVTPGLDASCTALRQYAALVVTDEFELVLPAPGPVKASLQRLDPRQPRPMLLTSKNQSSAS